MVTYSKPQPDAVFSALGDPTRRAIVARLARRPASVTRLAAPHKMSLQGVMKHLDVLERAGRISPTKKIDRRRDEDALPYPQAWLRLHDQYGA